MTVSITISYFHKQLFLLFQILTFCDNRKMGFGLQQLKTPQPELPYSRVVIITSTLGIWPALNSLRDDTAAVYVLLLDQIEKKETLLAFLLNDLEFQNK